MTSRDDHAARIRSNPDTAIMTDDLPRPIRSLGDFLYPAPAERRPSRIFLWWEGRRLFYNVAVGAAGLVTFAVFTVAGTIGTGGLFLPWQPALAFGVLANLFYTLGAALEVGALGLWGRRVLPIGPALYRMGLTFSMGLALLPTLLLMVVAVVAVVLNLLG